MTRNIVRSALRFGACLTLVGLTQVATAGECTLAGVAGKYGYTSGGSIIAPPVGAFAAVGNVRLTSTGTFTGAQTTSVAGNLFDETISGTYEVNRDCTGSATVFVHHGTTLVRTSLINLVWDDHQKELRAIFLTAGTAIAIAGRKMFGGGGHHEDDDQD